MPEIQHRPVILVTAAKPDTASITAAMAMVRAAGAEPMLISSHLERLRGKDNQTIAAGVAADLAKADGVLVMGNNSDIDPSDYKAAARHPKTNSERVTPEGVARAKYEYVLIAAALENKTPIFGICGGMHRLNVLLGGTLHQHVPDLLGGSEGHNQGAEKIPGYVPVEFVKIEEGTTMANIAGGIPGVYTPAVTEALPPGVVMENSFHHQAVDRVGEGLRPCAASIEPEKPEVRIIEAVEADPNGKFGNQFVMAVQWHPEFGASNLSPRLFTKFAEAAREYGQGKAIRQAQEETIRSLSASQQAWVGRIHHRPQPAASVPAR